MLQTIVKEMTQGNFSFLILIVGIAQLILMAINLDIVHKKDKKQKKNKDEE